MIGATILPIVAALAIVLGASDPLIWGVVAISAASLILNTITPSKRERVVAAPSDWRCSPAAHSLR